MGLQTTEGIVTSAESNQDSHRRGQNARRPFIRKIFFLGLVNLLAGGHVVAAIFPPDELIATSVCSNSVSLSWTDPNPTEAGESSVQVQRSTRGPNRGFTTIATLPAYATSFVDTDVLALTTYHYRVLVLNAKKRKFRSETITVNTPAPLSVAPAVEVDVPDTGGTSFTAVVTAGVACDWAAESMDPWITINSDASGVGPGLIAFSVAENTSPSSRTGTLLVSQKPLKVSQAGKSCSFAVNPNASSVSASAGSGSFSVATGSSCKWTATATDSWIHTTTTGTGSGMVYFTIDANSSGAPRAGTITVANQSFTVTQSAAGVTTTTISSPIAGGVTSGGGTFAIGSTVTVTATANACYDFVNWTENGVQVSTSASYSFTTSGNRALIANFSLRSYIITTSSSPLDAGTTSGGGSKICGTSVTVSATPNAGYYFVNWTENGSVASTSASYSFTANASRALVANFSAVPTYTIVASASPSVGGSASGGGTFSSGSTVTVVASPNSCYNFVNWTENGVQVSTSASYSFAATGNRSLVANFSQPAYAITTSSSPSAGGTTSGGGSKTCGTSVTVTATPNSGYNFVNWTENGTVVSSSTSYSFTAIGSRSLVANFSTVPSYIITTSSSPSVGGSTSGGGSYLNGSTATVVATPNACYDFVNWTDNGTVVSTSASYSFTVAGARSLVANFSQPTYTITTSSSPLAGGTASGGGSKTCGTSVTVTATPNSGYNFANWTENGTVVSSGASYTFTAAGNRTLVANFSTVPSYTIATSSSPLAGGSTSGGGSYLSGSSVTVVATANSCYSFVNWTENGVQVSTSASYSFTATGTRSLVANFSQPSYTITTSSSPSAGGTTSGGGSKTCGTSVTVTATPNSGYNFANWTENGTVVSSAASYTFTSAGNRTLVANFSTVPTYSITTSSSPSVGGSTSGGGTFASGATATVVATANSCYSFVNWTENGVQVSTSASYSFTVAGARSLVANFSQPSYTITTSSSPSAGGTASGGGGKTCGTSVTVTATPNSGYNFANWTENGSVVSSAASYTFTAAGNRTLVANFSTVPSYTIATSSSPLAGGSTSGGGSYLSGSSVTVVATANSCYSFVNWTENGVQVSASASYTFTATGARTLVANFSLRSYTITTSSSPSAGGTTSGGGSKSCGNSVTVTATPNSGYNFVNWTDNGATVSSSASYTFTAGSDRALVANFTAVTVSYTITTSSSPSAGGSTSGGGTFSSGATASLTATANSGYSFVKWTENGAVVSTASSYSFTVTGSRTLVANFTATTGNDSWVMAIGGTGVEVGKTIGTDADGNIFTAGYFNNTVDFGGTTLTSAGVADIFVAKYSPSGVMLWAKRFGSTSDDQAMALAVDRSSGDVVVTGYFMGTVAFGSTTYESIGGRDVFLVKLSGTTGAVAWSKQIGGQWGVDGEDIGYGVAVDARNGDVLLTGQISGWFDIGSGWVLTTSAASDTMLVRLSSSGTYQWAKTFVANGSDRGMGVAVDASGNILLTGTVSGTIDLGGGTLQLGGWYPDTYVAKFTAAGTHIWSKGFGNVSYTGVNALAVDGSGNVVLTGFFSGSLDFGNGALVGNNSGSGYVVKLAGTDGSAVWSRAFVASVGAAGLGVTMDSAGNVLVTGGFYLTCDFGGGTLTAPNYIHEGFLAKYAAGNGAHISSHRFGGTGDDRGFAVTVDNAGNVIVAGTTAGGEFSGVTLTSAGSNDILLMKLAP